MTKRALFWIVESAVYETPPTQFDPPETTCDYRVVRARTRRRAIVLATNAWRRANGRVGGYGLKFRGYYLGSYRLANWDDENPFRGVTARRPVFYEGEAG